ncbi:peptide chain release factor 2 [Planctomycetota bacterium]
MDADANARLATLMRTLAELRGSLDIEGKQEALAAIEAKMGQPGFWSDQETAQGHMRELKRLKAAIDPQLDFERRATDIEELAELADDADDAETLAEIARDLAILEAEVERFQLSAMLSGEYDGHDCFMMIHAGAGGTEACDWVAMLLRMYSRWLEGRRFEAEIIDSLEGEEAGYKSVTLDVRGPMAYGYCKSEVGVHRLVRISPFDAAARRHTSFASVDVVPQFEATEVDIEIDEKELRIDTYRAGGPGGQHVNVTDSAVRITHLPTGIVASCQNERSQHQNRAVAMKVLKARLYARRVEEQQARVDALSGEKADIAWGSQRRNYVLQPYTMVKDLVSGVETGDVQRVLDGDLDPFIEGYLKKKIGQGSSAATGEE